LSNSDDDIAVAGNSDAAGIPNVVQEPPSDSAASLWLPVAQSGGSLKFINASSGLCLGIYGDAAGRGRQLDQSTCSSRPGAAWQTFSFK
jgi:Ricin-type beta-trefoil lectin domain-like